MRKKNLPEIDPIVLPEKFGMRPGQYIMILFIIALLFVFFALCVLPGLISDSSYITFRIPGSGIAVYEDGDYLGSSEGSAYRSTAGSHQYCFYIGGIKIGEITTENPRHVFFTLFHKKTSVIEPELKLTAEAEKFIITDFAEKAAEWSKVYEHEDKFHVPPFFTELAENAVAFGLSGEKIKEAIIYGIMHITSEEIYDDFENAASLLESNGIAIDLSAYRSVLYELYKGNGISASADKNRAEYNGRRSGSMIKYPAYKSIAMGRDKSSCTYPDTNTFPASASAESFSISAKAVTEYEYALFAEANPKWAKSNREKLIEEGLADSGYLEGINLSTRIQSQKPIRSISYYAAEAYAEWLSRETGLSFSLPTEAEWYAAEESVPGRPFCNSLISIEKGTEDYPVGMLGQLWEFTSTPYIPLARIFDYSYSDPYGFDDIIVKGGSYISKGITGEDVGVISKSETSEYAGFRVVIHE